MRSNKGITLTTLVITIIVLMIVSSAIVFGLSGTGGMFTITRNVQKNYTEMESSTDEKVKQTTNKWGNVINKTGIDPALSVD